MNNSSTKALKDFLNDLELRFERMVQDAQLSRFGRHLSAMIISTAKAVAESEKKDIENSRDTF